MGGLGSGNLRSLANLKKKGDPKTGGKQKGYKSFKVLMDETIKEIAKLNNISVADAWKILQKKAYSEAKNGNFNFYKDMMDRYYGKTVDKVNVNMTFEDVIMENLKRKQNADLEQSENND